MQKTLIVSPHTDDAIFSLGDMISKGMLGEVTILSPFAGIPGDEAGRNKHITLRQEHGQACRVIGAKLINGDFLDDVYPAPDMAALTEWLEINCQGYDQVLIPLGIHHPDHIRIRSLFITHFICSFGFYEELPYRMLYPYICNELEEKYAGKRDLVFSSGTTEGKKQAVECYASQIIGGKILEQLYVQERIWL